MQVNKALSQKMVKSKKRIFIIDEIPSINLLYRQPNHPPKIFSSFFINKEIDKKTNVPRN